MKNLFLISSLLVSNLIFSQEKEISLETSTSIIKKIENFEVVLPENQHFRYISPSEATVYVNTISLDYDSDNPDNVKKVINLKGTSIDKFYKDVNNKKAQVIMGAYDVYVDSKDTNEVHKILRSSKSTQEFLFEMSKLKKVSRSELHFTGGIETFNPKFKEDSYYTINGFYYTIEKDLVGHYYVTILFPIGKERKL